MRSDRWRVCFCGTILVLLIVAAYANSFRGAWVFDDFPSILENPRLGQLSTAVLTPPDPGSTGAGRPLVSLSFAANILSGGTDIRGFHAVNLAIHVAAALLLFGAVRRTWRRALGASATSDSSAALYPFSSALIYPFLIAAIWALHPLQTESVTYIAQRAESLAGLCCLGAVYTFALAADLAAAGHGAKATLARGLSVAACWAGFASKESVAATPLVLLLLDAAFFSGSFRAAWRQHRRYYILLAAAWLPFAALVVASHGRGGTVGGSGSGGAGIAWWQYTFTQARAVLLYLRLSVWPHPLVFDYGRTVVAGAQEVVPELFAVVLLVATTIFLLARRLRMAFFPACFLLLLAPSSSFVPVNTQTIAEHRMYIALAPLVAGAVWLLARALRGRWRWTVLVPVIAAELLATARRNEDYHSARTLWQDTVTKRPENPRAHLNLGVALQDAGEDVAAVAEFERALTLDPSSFAAHQDLAVELARSGARPQAIAEFEKAIALQPGSVRAHYGLGMAWLQSGDGTRGIAELTEVVRLAPADAIVQTNLGTALLVQGEFAAAHAHLAAAVQLAPDAPQPRYNLALTAVRLGDLVEAERELRTVLAHTPDFIKAREALSQIEAARTAQ